MAEKKSNKNKGKDEDQNEADAPDQRDIEDQLADLGDDWDDTEEKVGGDVPPGNYQVKFTSVTINNAQSSGRLQASFEMTILDTEHRGRKLFSHFGLDDVDQRGYLRGALAKLGVEWPTKPKDLPDVLQSVEGTFAQVKQSLRKQKDKQSGELIDRTNVYFNRALDSTDVDDLEEDDKNDRDKTPSKKEDKKAQKEKAKSDKKPAAKTPAAEKEEDEEDEKEDEEKEDGVAIKFTVENLDKEKKHRTRIKKLAAKHDYDPEDYNSLIDLLGDVAEEVGVTGVFDDAEKLITLVEEKATKED